jgi:hypothetical protein
MSDDRDESLTWVMEYGVLGTFETVATWNIFDDYFGF